jgi:transcriptional regulator with XRE-family HTH domain
MNPARENSEHDRPAQVFARRVRAARESRGWTQAQLADRLREIGYPKSRETLTKLEGGRYRGVSLDDAFAIAAALGVAPVHLLVPLDDEAALEVVAGVPVPAPLARAWIRGTLPLTISPKVDLLQMPDSELVVLVEEMLGGPETPFERALSRDARRKQARFVVEMLRKPELSELSYDEWKAYQLEKGKDDG